MEVRWGVDLGGTKIEAAVLPESGSAPLARRRIPTEAEGGYEHILGRIVQLIRDVQAETGLPSPTHVGVGTPGVTDTDTGLLKNSNTTCLIGKPIREDLASRLS